MEQDLKMRQALGISDNEAVITMMAIGHIPKSVRVAMSPRRNAASIIRVIGEK